jgi:hypothetical protein
MAVIHACASQRHRCRTLAPNLSGSPQVSRRFLCPQTAGLQCEGHSTIGVQQGQGCAPRKAGRGRKPPTCHCLGEEVLVSTAGQAISAMMAQISWCSQALPGTLTLHEADLLKEGSFDEVVKGAKYVFHTASPFLSSHSDPHVSVKATPFHDHCRPLNSPLSCSSEQ